MRDLIETVRPLYEEEVGYRIENKYANTDEWTIHKSLLRGQKFGPCFDTLCWFPKDTSKEIVKRYFWKKYKIDIDRLPSWQRLVKIEK